MFLNSISMILYLNFGFLAKKVKYQKNWLLDNYSKSILNFSSVIYVKMDVTENTA